MGKTIAVVLGNRINDDGSLTKRMVQRLELALSLDKEMDIEYFVVSGGVANPKVDFSEAYAMKKYLVEKGMNIDKIIVEDKSLSTSQNAIYTYKILENYEFNKIVVVSSYEHFRDWNGLGFFNDYLMKNEVLKSRDIKLMIYTTPEEKIN